MVGEVFGLFGCVFGFEVFGVGIDDVFCFGDVLSDEV